jgi:hypothetical protein
VPSSPSVAVLPEHGPTLPEILPVRWRRAVGVVAGLLAVVVAVLLLKSSDGDVEVVRSGPVAFNFRHPEALRPVSARPGELLRLEKATAGGKFVQSFAVLPLALPAYRGDVGGVLPVVADAEARALRERYTAFELVEEGKARINEVPGYQIVFRARLGERRLFGRLVMLPEVTEDGPAMPRRGVRLLLEATPAAGVGRAEDVGVRGLNKRPFRSFRFGTEKP